MSHAPIHHHSMPYSGMAFKDTNAMHTRPSFPGKLPTTIHPLYSIMILVLAVLLLVGLWEIERLHRRLDRQERKSTTNENRLHHRLDQMEHQQEKIVKAARHGFQDMLKRVSKMENPTLLLKDTASEYKPTNTKTDPDTFKNTREYDAILGRLSDLESVICMQEAKIGDIVTDMATFLDSAGVRECIEDWDYNNREWYEEQLSELETRVMSKIEERFRTSQSKEIRKTTDQGSTEQHETELKPVDGCVKKEESQDQRDKVTAMNKMFERVKGNFQNNHEASNLRSQTEESQSHTGEQNGGLEKETKNARSNSKAEDDHAAFDKNNAPSMQTEHNDELRQKMTGWKKMLPDRQSGSSREQKADHEHPTLSPSVVPSSSSPSSTTYSPFRPSKTSAMFASVLNMNSEQQANSQGPVHSTISTPDRHQPPTPFKFGRTTTQAQLQEPGVAYSPPTPTTSAPRMIATPRNLRGGQQTSDKTKSHDGAAPRNIQFKGFTFEKPAAEGFSFGSGSKAAQSVTQFKSSNAANHSREDPQPYAFSNGFVSSFAGPAQHSSSASAPSAVSASNNNSTEARQPNPAQSQATYYEQDEEL